jgi:hypothetical protein
VNRALGLEEIYLDGSGGMRRMGLNRCGGGGGGLYVGSGSVTGGTMPSSVSLP